MPRSLTWVCLLCTAEAAGMAGAGRLRLGTTLPAAPAQQSLAAWSRCPHAWTGPDLHWGKTQGSYRPQAPGLGDLALNLYVHIYEMGTIHPVVQRLPRHGLACSTLPRMSLGGRKEPSTQFSFSSDSLT